MAGGGEEFAAGFGEGFGALADGDDVGELDSVEGVDRGELGGAEDLCEIGGFGAVLLTGAVPAFAEAGDLLGDLFAADAAARGEGGHAGDGGVEVAKIAEPMSVGRLGELEEFFASFLVERGLAAFLFGEAAEFVVEVW